MDKFDFKKKFGQNFLTDKNLLTQIVEKSGVMSDDVVVEIGAGRGALTEVLSAYAKKVYSFEIDKELFAFLGEKFDGTNVQMIFEDVMKVTDEEINKLVGGKFKLVANLPYYVTSPILTRFLQNENMVSCTVMVQEEVADRIVAEPKTKDYGVLTVICQMFGDAKKAIRVNRKMFYPVPNVDSAVVRIDKKEDCVAQNFPAFIEFVKKAFSMRRKKLSSNLETQKLKKTEIEKLLVENGFSEMARAEELSISDFKKFFALLNDKM
ncbi:MAG: ribosomal RNA small subunit methyltransferase A [Clostridia bacterium]|nr:ribosomal RNA small subunit methyltransferase A [Clostridia bacterium]